MAPAFDESAQVTPLGAVGLASALLVPTVLVCALFVALVVRTSGHTTAGGLTFLSGVPRTYLLPEPGEQRAYLLLLLAPLLLSIGLVGLHSAGCRMRSRSAKVALVTCAVGGQALILLLVAISLHRQQGLYPYFRNWQFVVAAATALMVGIAVADPESLSSFHRFVLRYRTGRRWMQAAVNRGGRRVPARGLWFVAALAATVAFLSSTVYTDTNIGLAPFNTSYHAAFTFEEFSAVMGGRTPLVDFTPQYTSLLPYLAAPVFAVTGLTIGAFTTIMAFFSLIGLMSVFIALMRVTGRSSQATLLYLPFLAMTFYPVGRDGAQVHTFGAYYAVLPLRYAFSLLLTSLVVGYSLSAHRWRSALLLGAVTGAGLVNNVDFGIAALGAVLVSVFVSEAARHAAVARWRAVAVAELRVMCGIVLAVAAFSVGTLMRSGSLPDFGELFYFSQQFATSGFFMLPMPSPFGVHLVMYLTFVLALALALSAAVLSPGDSQSRSRLGLLAYSGVFGLGAGSYYVGRSHSVVLIAIFAAWALCLAVLAAEVGSRSQQMLAAPSSARWFLVVPTAVLAGLLALCASVLSLDGFIFEQPQRLVSQSAPKIFAAVDMERFVADCTQPGEDVMMIYPLGHRIASDNEVSDHFPYNHPANLVTTRQVAVVAESLRANRLSAVFSAPLQPELAVVLREAGYRRVLERQPTVGAENASATGAERLELWRLSGAPLACG